MKKNLFEFRDSSISYLTSRVRDKIILTALAAARRAHPDSPRLAVLPSDYVGTHIILDGIYERREIGVLIALFRVSQLQETLCLDIGANVGNHSIAFAPYFKKVIAFEPNPVMASLVGTNILLSGAQNVSLHAVGLGQCDDDLAFGYADKSNFGTGSFLPSNQKIDGGLILPIRAGDAFIAAYEPEIARDELRVGFVKCDVEGLEADVFKGLKELLTKHSPIITFECNRREEGEAVWSVLSDAGYRNLYRFRQTGDSSSSIRRWAERLFFGHSCWVEPISAIPLSRANLIATVAPLTVA